MERYSSKIRVLQKDVEAQRARADKLEAALKDLESTLAGIVAEVEHSSSLLGETNKHLADGSNMVEKIAASIREQVQSEIAHRQELTGCLERLLKQHQDQSLAWREMFEHIQSRLTELAQMEQRGAEIIGSSIGELSDLLASLRAQTEYEFARTIGAVQAFTQAKGERSCQEAGVFEQLLTAQTYLHQQLGAIQAAAAGLAASSEQAQLHQHTRLVQTTSRQAQELNHQAALLLHRSDYSTAMLLLEEAVRLAPEDVAIQTNLALACLKSGQRERAESILLQVLAREPDAVIALNELGVLYLDQIPPDTQTALSYLQRAAHLAPEDAVIWLNLGKAYYHCGAIALALRAWQRAGQLAPSLVASDAAVQTLLDEQQLIGGGAA